MLRCYDVLVKEALKCFISLSFSYKIKFLNCSFDNMQY